MTDTEPKETNTPRRAAMIWPIFRRFPSVAFFVLFYLYLTFDVDLRFLYNGGGLIDNFPTFYRDWDFLQGHLAHPGGLIEYASGFLAQLFYYSWAGAAVVTCQAWLIGLATDAYLKTLGAPRLRVLRFVGPLVLVAMYSQYTFHFPMTLAFTMVLMAVCLFLRFAPQGAIGRGLTFLVLSLILYACAGGAYLLFALLCGGAEIVSRHRFREGVLYGLSGAVIPYLLGVVVWGQRVLDAYSGLLPLSLEALENEPSKLMLKAGWVLTLFLPLTAGIVGLWQLLFGRGGMPLTKVEPIQAGKKSRKGPPPQGKGTSGALGWGIETMTLVAMTAGTLMLYHDPKQKILFEVDYFSRQQMWSKVLEVGRRSPYHYLICHAVNRALYHNGQLGDAMFSYPQDPKALLLTGKEALWQKADTCMELGLINEAENALTISIEMFGEKPLLLQRLARINMVKGDINTSRVFLGALSKVPFWNAQAQDYLVRLRNDPNLSQDEEIQRLRAVRLKQDSVRETDTLRQLLVENPRNRMAYEYGMAWLLLTKNLAGFAQTFNAYHGTIESRIPRHYEEALLLSKALKQGTVNLPVQSISPESLNRLASFMKALQPFGRDIDAARKALKEGFGDSYYYYFFLSGSGVQ